jgi:hypothetical protein
MTVVKFPYETCRRSHKPISDMERKPKPLMRTACGGEDPIFAVIDYHRALSDRYSAAVEASQAFEGGPLEEAANEIVSEACTDLLDFCSDLFIGSEPTTLAGTAAFLGYVGTLEEWEQPRGDAFCCNKKKPSGWFFKLCQTVETVIQQHESPPSIA